MVRDAGGCALYRCNRVFLETMWHPYEAAPVGVLAVGRYRCSRVWELVRIVLTKISA